MLTREPDFSPEQLKANLEQIRLVPYMVRKILPDASKEAAKNFPRDPGGRDKSVKEEDYLKVWEEIGKLFAQGVKLTVAKQRVAQRHGVSLRTIDCVWSKRGGTAQADSDGGTEH